MSNQPTQPLPAGPSVLQQATSSSSSNANTAISTRQTRSATGAISNNLAGSSSSSSSSSSDHSLESIDAIVSAIQSISQAGDNNAQYKLVKGSLLPALNSLEQKGTNAGVPGSMILQSLMQGAKDPLLVLLEQPQLTAGGLGYLIVLLSRCQAENPDVNLLLHCIESFVKHIQPDQVRLAPQKLVYLALWTQHFYAPAPARAIPPVSQMLCALSPPSPTSLLTQLHPVLLLGALRANEYTYVNRLLDVMPDVWVEIDVKAAYLTYQDVLKWFLYAGTIHAIHGRYERAIDALEAAVAFPSHVGSTSLLQIDAYKRLILCQLLHDGKTSQLPKYASSHLQQSFRNLYSSSYLELAKAYEVLDHTKVYSIVNDPANLKLFEADGNIGLINRCLGELPKKAILRLKDTYKVISVDEVVDLLGLSRASSSGTENVSTNGTIQPEGVQPQQQTYFKPYSPTSSEEAKSYIQHLSGDFIASGLARFVIPDSPGNASSKTYLEFLTPSPTSTSHSSLLESTHRLLSNTQNKLQIADASLSSNKEFLLKAFNSVNSNPTMAGGMSNTAMNMLARGGMGASTSQMVDLADEELGMSGGGTTEFWED